MTPVATGLRIPSLVNTFDTRYLVLLSTRVIQNYSTRVCGIRQGLEIGMDLAPFMNDVTTERPVSLLVTTPTFRFSDGANVSWHLVKEPMIQRPGQTDPRQTASWAFNSSDTPAFLYSDFTASAVDVKGAPVNYPLTLLTYAPPTWAQDWQPIAGLKAIRDIRYPWASDQAWDSINEDVPGNWRISLYASILQTDPATRPGIVFNPAVASNGTALGGPPEEDFIFKYSFPGGEIAPAAGPQFWRIYGSILFEDEVAADNYELAASPRRNPGST